MPNESFLASLLTKEADIKKLEEIGLNTTSAQGEVRRQIRQCLNGGDIVKGETVTKSGEED